MRKTLITVIVCLALSVFCFQTSNAADESILCDSEPTNMPIDYRDVISCSIDGNGDTDIYSFNGQKDEVVTILGSRHSGSNIQPCIELIAPNNDRVIGCYNVGSNRIDATLNQTGTFAILISDFRNDETGGYALSLERVIPPSIGSSKIDFGETLNREINPIGDMDLFFFEGNTGDSISALGSRHSGSNIQPCIELIAPNNDRVIGCYNVGSNRIDATLNQTGTFAILISDFRNDGTGGYGLSLQCLNPPCGEDGPDDVFCNGQKVTILGTEGNDFLTGTDGPDVIHGLGGVDIIRGMGGNDIICGGDAADFLSGVNGNDKIFGEHGDDAIWGGPGDDILNGGDGHDSVKGGYGNDEIDGGDGHDVLNGLAGDDILRGNFGNDTLYGGDGVDELIGGWGPNNGAVDNNDTCYDTAGTVKSGCEVFYVE